jgi:aspartate racemase
MTERNLKRVGLVGGTSWVSSEHYYRALNEGVAARLGGAHSAPMTLWSVEFGDFARMQHDGDWDGVAVVLVDAARRLVAAGCDGIALAANTTHLRADDVRAAIGDVPLIDLVQLTAEAVSGYRTVGLLGTQFTMSSAMFPTAFGARRVRTLLPSVDDQRRVHDVIYDELTRNIVSDAARRDYLEIIDKLAADGAEAVVLACTEQGLLLRDGDAGVPLVDTTDLHCAALVDFILEGTT